MKKPKKTNAARLLDRHGVAYELREYDIESGDLDSGFGLRIAEKMELPPGQVFKTLAVNTADGDTVLACIPVDTELDLKALAAAHGTKKAELLPVKNVQPVTGYVRGCVSPVGTRTPLPVYLDDHAREWDVISLSAGAKGVQMLVRPADLGTVVTLRIVSITRK